MSDEGYTLVEMLVALAVLALALGGLFQSVKVIGRYQTSAAQALAAGRAEGGGQARLQRFLDGAGPFFSDDRHGLAGSAKGLRFPCGDADVCSARLEEAAAQVRLVLRRSGGGPETVDAAPGATAFHYVGEGTTGDVWPPADSARQRLKRVVLIGPRADGETPLASIRLWKEEARDCDFDVIAQACRSAAP